MRSLTQRAWGVGAGVRDAAVENPSVRSVRTWSKLKAPIPEGGGGRGAGREENQMCSLCVSARDAPYGGLAPCFFSPEKRGA